MARTTDQETLGDCPQCAETIPSSNLLIQYETGDGTAVYAECPACTEPVHPS